MNIKCRFKISTMKFEHGSGEKTSQSDGMYEELKEIFIDG